jgi:formyl-CoA transferase
MADCITALALACGISTALFIRERTGTGQEVDASLFQTGVFILSGDIATTVVTRKSRKTTDREERASPLENTYQTKDGRWLILALGPQADRFWPRLCRDIGLEDLEKDPRFVSIEARAENHLALFKILEEMFLSRTLTEWKTALREAEFPWSPLQNYLEVIEDPQARANDFFIPFDDPTYGRVDLIANPIKLSKTPEIVRMGAPAFGQNTDEVLTEYGYKAEDIAQFREQGVIA